MKQGIIHTLILLLGLTSCTNQKVEQKESPKKKIQLTSKQSREEQLFVDSLYNRESNKYISKLEEIPNRDSNAYKLTISSKNGKKLFSKILNTRPRFSQINYCTDLYTVVGFPCGGPCYSQVFVFTDKNRSPEQYDFVQTVSNNSNIITHIKNEEFEKLLIHNLKNNKELSVDIPDNFWLNYGRMDSIFIIKDKLILHYVSKNEKKIKKVISLASIL